MQPAEQTFSTDKFIERACIALLVLLCTVTVIACIDLNKIYGVTNEVRLIAIPAIGAVLYIFLSLINNNLSLSRYIRSAISGTVILSHQTLNRMLRAIKLSLLVTITFNTIETLQKAFNISSDMQEIYTASEIMLVLIPVMYILLQLYKSRATE